VKTSFKSFSLGLVVATPGVLEAVAPERLLECLARHARGDYGNVCTEDAELNNRASHDGGRILSAYPIDPAKPCKGHGENCIWVLTSASDDNGNRESTCIMLPDEY
jgi:hypothetical protein